MPKVTQQVLAEEILAETVSSTGDGTIYDEVIIIVLFGLVLLQA